MEGQQGPNYTRLTRNGVLEIRSIQGITDLAGIERCTGVLALHVANCQNLTDFSQISRLRDLQTLSLNGCYKLQSAHVPCCQNLVQIDLSGNNIVALVIGEAPNCQDDLAEIQRIQQSEDYQMLKQLFGRGRGHKDAVVKTSLSQPPNSLASSQASSRYNVTVRRLDVSNNPRMHDFSGVLQFTALEELCLRATGLVELAWIGGLSGLRRLDISQNCQIRSFVGMGRLRNVQTLICNNVIAPDSRGTALLELFGEIGQMAALEELELEHNRIGELGLLRCAGVKRLSVAGNLISSAAELHSLAGTHPAITQLDIGANAALRGGMDMSAFPKLEEFRCAGCPHFAPTGAGRLRRLDVSRGPMDERALLNAVRPARDSLVCLDAAGCPNLRGLGFLGALCRVRRINIAGNPQIGPLALLGAEAPAVTELDVSRCNLDTLSFLLNDSFRRLRRLNVSYNGGIACNSDEALYLLFLPSLRVLECCQDSAQPWALAKLAYFTGGRLERVTVCRGRCLTGEQLRRLSWARGAQGCALELQPRYRQLLRVLLQILHKRGVYRDRVRLVRGKTRYNYHYVPQHHQFYKVTKRKQGIYTVCCTNIDTDDVMAYKNTYTEQNIDFSGTHLYDTKPFVIQVRNNGKLRSLRPLNKYTNIKKLAIAQCHALQQPFFSGREYRTTKYAQLQQDILYKDSLVFLCLSYNNMTDFRQLEFIVDTFRNLTHLDLSGNNFDYRRYCTEAIAENEIVRKSYRKPAVPDHYRLSIGHMQRLRYFDISENCGMSIILDVSQLASLRVLRLSGVDLREITIGHDSRIESIDLSNNPVLVLDFAIFRAMQALKVANLSGIRILHDTACVGAEVDNSTEHSGVTELHICYNRFLSGLKFLKCLRWSLRTLSLEGCHLSEVNNYLQDINALPYLETLNVANNRIQVETLDLEGLQKLHALNIAGNDIQSIKLADYGRLYAINISHNHNYDVLQLLTFTGLQELKCEHMNFGKSYQIRRSNTYNMNTGEIDAISVVQLTGFEILQRLRQLRVLDMRDSVVGDKQLYDQLNQMLQLRELDMSNVQVFFRPETFMSRSVHVLKLKGIGLTRLSHAIKHCVNLEWLDISYNHLSDPTELFILKNNQFLRRLWIQGNQYYVDDQKLCAQHNRASQKMKHSALLDDDMADDKRRFVQILLYSLNINIQSVCYESDGTVFQFNQEMMLKIKDELLNIFFYANCLVQ